MNLENTLISTLGMEFIKIEDGEVIATMPVDGRTKQPFGLLHGGASVALAETIASVGAYHSIDQENEICVGLEINANHIKSKKEGIVTGIGKVLHKGSTTMIWEVKIVDENEQLLCISRCTMAVLKKK